MFEKFVFGKHRERTILMRKMLVLSFFLAVALGLSGRPAAAQTTAFTYQGKLTESGAPASGPYDFNFRLFSVSENGAQIGADVLREGVQVTGGIFSVSLDFGASPFTSATGNFLEIAVRAGASTGAYTTLAPRQPVTSSPYAVQTLRAASAETAETATNALNLGGTAASQFVQTSDTRLSDARPPTAGSANYIQNSTVQQPLGNFNIDGNGKVAGTLTAGTLNVSGNATVNGQLNAVNLRATTGVMTSVITEFITSSTKYHIGVDPVLSIQGNSNPKSSVAIGVGAGLNAGGDFNSFLGWDAGRNNTGISNSFFGATSGFNNGGSENSFFGQGAGRQNTSGNLNSFFGSSAANLNTTGSQNSVFGQCAGCFANLGDNNSLFGRGAGWNTSGGGNSFFGRFAGNANASGNNNTIVGANANVGAGNLTNANAFGANSFVTQSNSLVLGSIDGVNGATADTFVGIGTTAPRARLHIANGSLLVANPGSLIITSPNGACWFLTVSNTGALSTFSVACP